MELKQRLPIGEDRQLIHDIWKYDEPALAVRLDSPESLRESDIMLSETILRWVIEYGYVGIFSVLALGIIGALIPDEGLLAFAGIWSTKVN